MVAKIAPIMAYIATISDAPHAGDRTPDQRPYRPRAGRRSRSPRAALMESEPMPVLARGVIVTTMTASTGLKAAGPISVGVLTIRRPVGQLARHSERDMK